MKRPTTKVGKAGRLRIRKPKRRIEPAVATTRKGAVTYSDLLKRLDERTSELAQAQRHLAEALERQSATSEVLKVISSSPGNLQPVFQATFANAMHNCEAQCGFIYRMDGGDMRAMAEIGVPLSLAEYRRNHTHTDGTVTPVDVMRATKYPLTHRSQEECCKTTR